MPDMILVEVVESVTEAYTSSDHARPKSPCGGLLQCEGLPGSSARDSRLLTHSHMGMGQYL